MAYTITQPVNEYLPGENLSWFEMDSDNKNESSFNYKMILKITKVDLAFVPGSTGSDVVGTFRVPPRPVTGNAYFSPNAIAKNYVSSHLQFNTGSTVGLTDDGIRKYEIWFGEEYVDGSGNLVSTDNVLSNTYYIWDSIIQDEDFPDYSYFNYVIKNNPLHPGPILTDGPEDRVTIENDNLYALIYPDTYNPSTRDRDYYLTPYYQLWVAGVMSFWVNETPTGGQARPWVEVNTPTDGITVLSGLNVGEYSMAVYLPPSGSIPHGTGPFISGDLVNILIRTRVLWVNNDLLYDLELWGKLTSGGTWVKISDFQKIQANGNETYFRVQNVLINQSFQYIGFVTRRNATLQSVPPTLYQIERYDVTTTFGLNWKYTSESEPWPVGIDYPINQLGKITWINAGTDGVGSTNEDYTIAIYDGNNARLSSEVNYSNGGDCGGCEKMNITWLNSLGGYDTYEFNCVAEKELDVTRVSGERTLPPNYTLGQRGKLNSSNVANKTKVVATDYTTQENIDWLESLFMSTDVFEVDQYSKFTPIVIDDSSYSQFVNQDKLKMVEFGYTVAYTRKSQIN